MPIRLSLLVLLLRFWLPLLLACAYAARRGGTPERAVAAMLLAAALLTLAVRADFVVRFSTVQLPVVLVDIALFLGLLAVALKADRRWPMISTALQGLTLMGHLGKALNPDLWRLGYAVMIAVPVLPGIVVLVVATWRHDRRLRTIGSDPPWSG